ncbi:MAG: hypothetical protein KF752_19750 [Pirellulaceae bacterium]|nr:hypothetical protein [Pirellulaceae bacterium]
MLDRRLGTQQFAVIGFAVGFLMGTTGLIVLARKLTPPARGKPLEWEDAATTDPSENGQDGAKERENSLRDPEN